MSEQDANVKCPKCGHVMQQPDWRCPECYFEFEDYSPETQQESPSQPVVSTAAVQNNAPSNPLSFARRITPVQYFWSMIGLGVLAGLSLRTIGGPIGIAIFVLAVAGYILQSIKRLHDLDRPAWHVLLLLIPIYSIFLWGGMLSEEGTDGANRYGPQP